MSRARRRPKAPRKPQPPKDRERAPRWPTGVVVLLHVAGLLMLFQPAAGLLSDLPVLAQDWGQHQHHLRSLDAYWRDGRRTWGYNPYFMAGYPSNTIQDLSIKLYEIVAVLASPLGLVRVFKIAVFLATAAVPLLCHLAAASLYADDEEARLAPAAAALLGALSWWGSLPREMLYYGMVGFQVMPYAALLVVGLAYSLLRDERPRRGAAIAFVLLLVAFVPLHPQGPLVAGLPCLGLIAWGVWRRRFRGLAVLCGAAAVALVANLPWIVPLLSHRHDAVTAALLEKFGLFVTDDRGAFWGDYLGSRVYFAFRTSPFAKGWRLALLVVGVTGFATGGRGRARLPAILLGSNAAVMYVLAYFGSFIGPARGLQPLRFKVALDAFLVMGAARALAGTAGRIHRGRPPAMAVALAVGVASGVIDIAQTESNWTLFLRTEPPPRAMAIARWIERAAPPGSRVLFEESGDETGFVHEGMYLSSFLPYWTRREVIGGPCTLYPDRHQVAHFYSGKLLGRDVDGFSDDELRRILWTYNVGAIVAFEPASIRRFLSVPGLARIDAVAGPVALLVVKGIPGAVLEGAGLVTAGPNSIRYEGPGGDVTLRYHWIEGLACDPPREIRAVPLLPEDPIPFVRVLFAPPTFELCVGPAPRP